MLTLVLNRSERSFDASAQWTAPAKRLLAVHPWTVTSERTRSRTPLTSTTSIGSLRVACVISTNVSGGTAMVVPPCGALPSRELHQRSVAGLIPARCANSRAVIPLARHRCTRAAHVSRVLRAMATSRRRFRPPTQERDSSNGYGERTRRSTSLRRTGVRRAASCVAGVPSRPLGGCAVLIGPARTRAYDGSVQRS
jgi:hypothetical protein